MSDEPLAHLPRSCPPWREPDHTECGRPLSDVAKVMALDEAKALIAKHGRQRAAFLLCMTCAETVSRHASWERSPSAVIGRESNYSRWRDSQPPLIDRELLAVAALVDAHRAEFDGYLTDHAETVSLTARRSAKRAATAFRVGGKPS